MSFLLILFVLILIIFAYSCYEYLTHYKYLDQFHGKKWIPLIGNANHYRQNGHHNYNVLMKWCYDFKFNTFRGYIGRIKHLICVNVDDVQAVLSNNSLIEKAAFYDLFRPWLGDGLLTTKGAKWHKHRKMITPTFHFSVLHGFLDSINENSTNFIEFLQKKANGETFDCEHIVSLAALDIICETAMGVKVNALKDSESTLVKSYTDVCDIIQKRAFSIFGQSDHLFKLTHHYMVQKNALDEIHKFNNDVIQKRKITLSTELNHSFGNLNNNDSTLKRRQAFLDTLLTSTIDDKPLSDKILCDEVATFIFEGYDTTASTLSFALYNLSVYPEFQEKVFMEQFEMFGNDVKVEPQFKELKSMNYLEMFIKETSRLYPAVPIIGRRNQDFFNLNGRLVPPNTNIIVLIAALGHNPDIFENPEIFDPERFSIENRQNVNPFGFVPFSAGPRNCIGQKFAMLEMKSVLSKIVRNFVILPSHDKNYKPMLSTVVTFKSDNGINIALKPRVY